MVSVVVDTDIIIDFLRTQSGTFPKLLELQASGQTEVVLSVVSVVELYAGQSSKTKNEEQVLSDIFSRTKIVPLSFELSRLAGEAKRDRKLSIAFTDLIVGATAIFLNGELATRNRKHFAGLTRLKFFDF